MSTATVHAPERTIETIIDARTFEPKRKPNAPTPRSAQEAKERYQKGMTHYNLGEFDAAIEEFKAAYEAAAAHGAAPQTLTRRATRSWAPA